MKSCETILAENVWDEFFFFRGRSLPAQVSQALDPGVLGSQNRLIVILQSALACHKVLLWVTV